MIPAFFQEKKSEFLSPSKVLDQIDIQKGETVIEFGSGPGFWTIPLAKKVGPKGSVIALDNRDENLMVIKLKAEKEALGNIKLVKASYNSETLPIKEKGDLILFSNILSLSKSWKSLLSEIAKNSKPGSKMVVIDWNMKKLLFGKKSLKNWSEDIIMEARKSGFEFRKLIDAGDFHFGLYFVYEK